MRLEQTYVPDFKYCTYCGKETKSETCSEVCTMKLRAVQNAMESQKEHEKQTGFGKRWTDKTIRAYNSLMDMLDK